ncbi:MAG: hypothetical protein OES69_16405 [Myxococcales bacterium]|nr:hypothetical protein [Myxococcales bacterium]MDH3845522.1 hypothetical protein [Myxococcales bacterium]
MAANASNLWLILCGALGIAVAGCGNANSEGTAGAGGGAGGTGGSVDAPLVTSGYVASAFGFFYPDSLEAEVPGFDLDQRVSSVESPTQNECTHDDFAGPGGEQGIDYNFLRIIFDEEQKADGEYVFGGFRQGQIVDGVINGAVKNGSMTVLLDVRGLDDPQNDDEVTVQVFGSEDSPMKGTNDEVLPFATLGVHPNPRFHTEAVRGSIVDGVLTAGPFDLIFPINIQIVNDEFIVHDSWLRIELGDDTFQGLVAGFWDVSNIRDIIGKPTTDNGNAANFTIEQFETAMALHADGDYDQNAGLCTSFTTMFTFSGVQAFIVRGGGGGGAGGAGGSGGSGTIGLPVPSDQCTNEADLAALDAIATEAQTGLEVVGQLTEACTLESCIATVLPLIGGDASDAALRAATDCVGLCISDATGISAGCASCYGLTVACGAGVCYDQCAPPNQGSPECAECSLACIDLGACTGL